MNVSSERAQDDLAKLDLTAKIVIESSSEITEGNVIRTDPEAGVSVEEGSTVTVHVSSGVETVVVPKIEGMGLEDATKALKAAGLELGTVIQRNDKGLAAGTVISASEAAETEVAPDTVVNLVVASGKVTLTDLVGWTVEAATTNLTDLGLTPEPVEEADCAPTEPPTVHSMSVAPGDVPIGSPVELRYCAAP